MGHPSRLGLIDSQEPVERDHPLNAGLVAWWLGLRNNSGGNTLFDLTGRYPGTLTNGPTWSPGPHGFGGLSFDNSAESVNCGTTAVPTAGTLSMLVLPTFSMTDGVEHNWFRVRNQLAVNASLRLFDLQTGTDNNIYAGWYNGTGADRRAVVNRSTAGMAQGVWAWLCMTWNGTTTTLYLNAISVATNSAGGTWATAGHAQTIGNDAYSAKDAASVIADVRLFNVTLPAAEVYALYEQSLRGHPGTLRRYSTAAWFVPPAAGGSSDGTLSVTLAAPTLSAAGTAAVAGAATPTLTAPTLSAAGTVAVVGTATPTLAAPTLSAAGTVAVVGTLSATLAAPTLTAAGTAGSVGTATITLATPSSTAAGTVAVAGSATPALAVPTPTAAGTVSLSGSAGVTLDLPALAAAGAVAVTAELAAALAGYTLSAAGTVADLSGLTATLAVTLDGPTLLAAGRGRRRSFDPAGDMALFDADRTEIDPGSDMDYFD